MRQGAAQKRASLSLFAALQFVWILLATLGLWSGLRTVFGFHIDEQVWMFGITLPLTLVSMGLSRMTHWTRAPVLIAVSTALHLLVYFVPLFLLMDARLNIYAVREIAFLVGFIAFFYTCGIAAGLLVFRFFKKEPAT